MLQEAEEKDQYFTASDFSDTQSSSEDEYFEFLDPDFEMNEQLGEPDFGRAGMEHHMW